VQIFIINLDRSPDRLAFMRGQAERLDFEFERVAAVNGLDVPSWLSDEFAGPHSLFPGEVGCFASHLIAAKQIVSRDLDAAIVMEDDAVLPSDFMAIVENAVKVAPTGWDVIHLCSLFKKSVISIDYLESGRRLVRYTQWPASAVAYVLSNRGARKVLSPRQRILPLDIQTRYAWRQGLDIVGVYPAPVTQRGTFSTTVRVGARRASKPWLAGPFSLFYGAMWTARKIGVSAYIQGIAWNYVNSTRKYLGWPSRVAIIDRSGIER
jgi:glycosyl transferase family 25